ncbi:hypothetical protein [Lutibacter sp. B1]|uniref:hypothetical protein n=1 Tax=Lutibacter sp. B1 TaxID=2725996 RepID=UPI0014571AF8|nr:hypothetical protein [Lutibacter sp. B1]NLP57216.1 hypothetical protein [Lutibacter sp. B1]
MKKPVKFVVVTLLIIAGVYIYMTQNGHNLESILNTPKKIELKADCSKIENLLLTSSTELTVTNLLGRTHNNVTVRITAYDSNNNILKQKNVVFERTLEPNGSLKKPVLLPAKTSKCDCIVLDSNPD